MESRGARDIPYSLHMGIGWHPAVVYTNYSLLHLNSKNITSKLHEHVPVHPPAVPTSSAHARVIQGRVGSHVHRVRDRVRGEG